MISSVTAMMRKRVVTKERTNATVKVSSKSSPSLLFEGSATWKKRTSIVRLLCFLVVFVVFILVTFLHEIKQLYYFSLFGNSTKAPEIDPSVMKGKMETLNNSTVSDSLESFAASEQGYKQVKGGEDRMKQEIVRGRLVPGKKNPHHKERKIVKKKDRKGNHAKLDDGGSHPWDRKKKKKKNKVNPYMGFKFKDS